MSYPPGKAVSSREVAHAVTNSSAGDQQANVTTASSWQASLSQMIANVLS